MSATAAYNGLQVVYDAGGSVDGQVTSYPLTTNSATGFFNGDIVHMAAGVLTPVTATPTTSQTAATPWGIFIGANWTDASGKPQYTQYFPAGGYTAYSAYGPITLQIVTDPDIRFEVQADGAVTQAKIGLNAQLGNFSAGSTVTGNSGVNLVASSAATTNTFGVKIIDIAAGPDNAAGDAYTRVICIWNQNVHAFKNILGA